MSTVQTSANDKRKYRALTLSNRLEVLLVEDPDTEKSSACCDVRVGGLSDPSEAQGLAHFLEHMLFLGTADYPEENAYSSFLNSHGGHSNAYTASENTVYYFDVQSDFLEEGLNMFSAFFTSPLFTESATNRELNAVDSENTKNLQSDPWRLNQLLKSLSRPDHPFSGFSTGNLQTLVTRGDLDIRQQVINFYEKYYSSNIMKLVVYGRESLDVLQTWVQAKFSRIPDKDLPVLHTPSDPFDSNLGHMVEVVPITDSKSLELLFPMPAVSGLYRTKPERHLSHLLGHESAGSVLAALKDRGWANGLSSYAGHSLTDFSILGIDVDLTDEGVLHADEVAACVFSYIGLLRRDGVPEWVQRETQSVMDMNFRFISKSSPSNYATSLANNMHLYPQEHFVSGSKLIFDLDVASVQPYIDCLHPDNAIIILKHKGLKGKTTCTEKYYGTEYNLKPFSLEQKQLWTDCSRGANSEWASKIAYPQPNPFIATNFVLVSVDEPSDESSLADVPLLLLKQEFHIPDFEPASETASVVADAEATTLETSDKPEATERSAADEQQQEQEEEGDGNEEGDDEEENTCEGSNEDSEETILENHSALVVWFKQDRHWKIPKANVLINLETIEACNSPQAVVLTEMLAACLKEVLSQFSYYADCAGLHYDVTLAKGGLELSFSGYNDKLPVLALRVVDELRLLGNDKPCEESIFNRVRQSLLRQYRNFKFSQPYYLSLVGTACCLEDPRWSDLEKFNALSDVTLADLHRFTVRFLRALKVEMLIHGNFTAAESSELGKSVLQSLGSKPLPLSQLPARRLLTLSPGTNYVYRLQGKYYNPNELNSAVENLYMVTEGENGFTPSASLEDDQLSQKITLEALTTFVAHIFSEPAFDQLRTKEQLGYIVHTGVKRVGASIGLHFIVQSSHKDPVYLDNRVEQFVAEFTATSLAAMPLDAFETNKKAVLELLNEKPKNLNEECSRYFNEIKLGCYLFRRKKLLAVAVSRITKDQVLDFIATNVLPSPQRRKFSSQLFSVKAAATCRQRVESGSVLVTDSTTFKRSLPLNPIDSPTLPESLL